MKTFRVFAGILLTCQLFAVCQGQERSVIASAAAFQNQNPAATPSPAKKDDKKDKGKGGARTDSGFCGRNMPVEKFVVDASGSVNNTGRTFEGPACIEVFYNPIQSYVSLATNTTTVNGPDLSQAATGGKAQAGVSTKFPQAENISQEFAILMAREQQVEGRLRDTEGSFTAVVSAQDKAISDISLLRSTTKLRSPSQAAEAVREGYKGLKDDLDNAKTIVASYHPTDTPGPNQEPPVLAELQEISDRLARMPLAYLDVPSQAANSKDALVCIPELKANPDKKSAMIFTPDKNQTKPLSWSDWSSKCKSGYDQLKTQLDSKIQEAKSYVDASDNTKLLKSKVAIVLYWDTLFNGMGLRTNMTAKQIDDVDLSPFFYAYTGVRCGTLFNQTANTAVNLVAADLGPTLEGKAPEVKAQGAFVTVSCGTPFSISAGVGFSTIRQQEFAIVKSSGGAGNPSVNTFGVINDSRITPMPMVMANVRLREWNHHKYAFHGSFGISGNLQNQASGGSTAEFLPAGTFSFWRTMYVSFGPQIGTKSELAGGFSVGQAVPSDITTIDGQVKRTRTVGFGFAITFTKP